MSRAGTFKPTLQLRHQLNCSGITIDAATYDVRRHHLLTYDSHALKPHTLRLFSLRREIRSTPLFDDDNRPPPLPPLPPPKKGAKPASHDAAPRDPIASTVLRYVSLVYANELDVFICVYSAYHDTVAGAPVDTSSAGYSIVFLEPATLKKLVVYTGPSAHVLRCACFDETTGRLVLASRVASPWPESRSSGRRTAATSVRVASPSAGEDRSNVVEFLEISKRPFRRPMSAISVASAAVDAPMDRVMLCVEKMTRASLWHSDALDDIAAAPHLHVLFGSGVCRYDDDVDSDGYSPGVQERSLVLEWRKNAEGTLALARRIVHERDPVTSLSASPSGQWLFTGHLSGLLKVWNMACKKDTDDDNPPTFAPAGDAVSFHKSAVAMIEVKPTLSSMRTADGLETLMLYTTERASGETRHWRFSGAATTVLSSAPQLDCLGELNVEPTRQLRKYVKKKRKRGMLGDWTRTTPLCITVQMGNYAENLLIVTRGDMIHVIKIQTLLQVVHGVPQGDEIFAVRPVPHRDGSIVVVCFSGTTSSFRLQLSGMDPLSNKITAPRECSLSAPGQLHSNVSARLTRMHVSNTGADDAWILCGWSTGVVEVYSEENGVTHRVALLQDPRLNVDVTALAIMTGRGAQATHDPEPVAPNDAKNTWGGLLKSVPHTGSSGRRSGENPKQLCTVLAGTAGGAIFGWRVATAFAKTHSGGQFILEASIAITHPPAHSAHVIELIPLSRESSQVLSMGADGILKLWAVPSMRLTKHINAAASTGAGGTRLGMLCSAVEVIGGVDAIAVGYEDGEIAVWQNQATGISEKFQEFAELHVSGRHERRVTTIADLGDRKFLTASLDMTIVVWMVVSETKQVDEVRFFELGGPVVDCCVVGSTVLAALGDEVCWFTLEEGATAQESPPPLSDQEFVSSIETIDAVVKAKNISESDECQPEENSPRSPATSSLSPSQHDDSVISIPSVIIPGSVAPLESFPEHFRACSSGLLEGWLTDQASDSPVDDQVISLYVRQYVATCGTSGTIAAESLGHFLSMHHVPLNKRARPDFVIRKYLHEHKIDPKTRLTAVDATSLLLEIQRAVEFERDDDVAVLKTKTSNGAMRHKVLTRLAEPRKKGNRIQSAKRTDNRIAVVTYNILGEKSIRWVESSTSNQEVLDAATVEKGSVPTEIVRAETRPSRHRRRRKGSPMKSVVASPAVSLPDRELLQRMHLSSTFQPMWSSGFCWCIDSQLVIQWDAVEAEKKTHSIKCTCCGHWRHRIKLEKQGYKPHFTARTILSIISDVYEIMMEPAHRLLYLNDDSGSRSPTELSIHAALWKLFQHKFGVQHIVETKLKLLFVSMCHHVRDMDAVAVFGEMLALFQRPDDDEQVPHKMVALCVVTHSWLYAREMVVNGDPILGNTDTSVESSKATHWQFVSLTNALFCAQEVLVYPLVSPGYLQNILVYMEDYAQKSPSKSSNDTGPFEEPSGTRWIEVHRLLRLLVGEWKQQTTDFRRVERLLFTEPLVAAQEPAGQDRPLATVLEKLRLILSCFVFYDHERVGLAEVNDFEDILRRLKYLWPNEHLSEQEAAGAKRYQDSLTFENTILATRKRFGDAQGDGRICYLDFWAMLYIVGVRTRSLLKFREIPSFCKDYKLEVSPDLQDMLRVYMGRSSALLLPRGFQTAKSSVDESTHHQHQRRVGGLYDGVYIVDKPNLTRTLSMQELLSDQPSAPNSGLYVDGSIPSMRQSASTTALDAYSFASREVASDGVLGSRPREPIVVGVRPAGPKPKSTAFLSVSSLIPEVTSNAEEEPALHLESSSTTGVSFAACNQNSSSPASASLNMVDSYANVYIQFPDITPRKTRVDVGASLGESIVGCVHIGVDEEAEAWRQQFIKDHENDEHERNIVHEEHKRRVTLQKDQAATVAAIAAAQHRHNGRVSPSKDKLSPSKPETSSANLTSTLFVGTSRHVDAKKTTAMPSVQTADPVVVIPAIEKRAVQVTHHSPSTIETLTRHAIQDRSKAPVVETHLEPAEKDVQVDHHDSFPMTRWDTSPRQEDDVALEDSVAHEFAIDVQPQVSAPLGEERVTQLSPVSSPRAALPQAIGHTISEEVDTVEVGANAQESDCSGENPSCDELSDSDDGNEEDMESESNDNDETKSESTVDVIADARKPDEPTLTESIATTPTHADHEIALTLREATKELKSSCGEMNYQTASEVLLEHLIPDEPDGTEDIPASSADHPKGQPSGQMMIESKSPRVEERRASAAVVQVQPTPKQDISIRTPDVKADLRSPTKQSAPSAQPSPPRPGSKPNTAERRHRFKFSQQPKFKLSAAIMSNPFRSKAWKPRDDSASDNSDEDRDNSNDEADAFDDRVAVTDMPLRLSRNSLATLREEFGRKTSATRTAGLTAMAFASGTSARHRANVLGLSTDEGGPRRRGGSNPVRLDEDAERALYGGRALSYLGEGIAFSADAEAEMQHKWTDFFGTAEATMFSPLKEVIKQREDAQRQEEELQSRLIKKRMEQQHLDTMRLQRNVTAVAATKTTPEKTSTNKSDAVSFRARRMTREACLQVQQQLMLGETVTGELSDTHAVQYFHFEYELDGNTGCSIITFKLHVLHGEADMFVSTQTVAPCSADFMWRSAEKCMLSTTPAISDLEGQKIVLFPHDIVRVLDRGNSPQVKFFLAVVALAPKSAFTLGVMTSGQKAEPSRAIQTVDNLISHFNQLAKMYEGQATRRMNMTAESSSSITRSSSSGSSGGSSSVDRLRAFLATAASMESVGEEDEDTDSLSRHAGDLRRSSQLRRRSDIDLPNETNEYAPDSRVDNVEEHHIDDDEGSQVPEESSFQRLLESFGEKRGGSLGHSRSFVLGGPTAAQRDFLQDEEASYQETKAKLASAEGQVAHDDGQSAAIAVVTERRLSTASSQALRQRLGARVKQQLSPLKGSSKPEVETPCESVSLRVARFQPKLAAYSLSSLHPPKHQHKLPNSAASIVQAKNKR